ncbi:MAG: hypothetical protein WCE49_20485, partial [Terrimicrobiaceae bacterium]
MHRKTSTGRTARFRLLDIDSPTAFEIARQFAAANDKHLDTVSYVLQQTGSDSAPIWQVWC